MVISIRLATIDAKQVIHNLLQDYLEELSGFPGESIDYRDENGMFRYPYLDAYWQENERFPYLLVTDSGTAGFALVRRDTNHWEMAEFYVKPVFRHRGTGLTCATLIIREHPGMWSITCNKANYHAGKLWRILAKLTSTNTVKSGMIDRFHEYLEFSTI